MNSIIWATKTGHDSWKQNRSKTHLSIETDPKLEIRIISRLSEGSVYLTYGDKVVQKLVFICRLLLLHYHSRRLYFLLGYAQSLLDYLFFCGFGFLAQSRSTDYFTHRTVYCPTDIERSHTEWITMYYSPTTFILHISLLAFLGAEARSVIKI